MNGARVVNLTSGKSLETFINESSETIKKTLGIYADNLAWVKTGHEIFKSDQRSTVPYSQRACSSPATALSKS